MTDRCLQCGRPPGRGPVTWVPGGFVHAACRPAPAGTIARTVEPPTDLDLRQRRAERVRPYRAGETPLGEWVRGVAGAQRASGP